MKTALLLLALVPSLARAQGEPVLPHMRPAIGSLGPTLRVNDPWSCNTACQLTAIVLAWFGAIALIAAPVLGLLALSAQGELQSNAAGCALGGPDPPCSAEWFANRTNDMRTRAASSDVAFGVLAADGIATSIFAWVILREQAAAEP